MLFIKSMQKMEIIFEDEHLIAINKPAMMVVNFSKTSQDHTVQEWFASYLKLGSGAVNDSTFANKSTQSLPAWQALLPEHFPNLYGTPQDIFDQRQGIVHRLDKDTSGILLLAKNPGSLINLLTQFRERQVKKKYLCLVHGQVKLDSGEINLPLARCRVNRHKYAVDIDGRAAITHYRVIKRFPPQLMKDLVDYLTNWPITINKDLITAKVRQELIRYQQGFSLLECLPQTGRTHQIRVHLSYLGHPLVADHTYSGKRRVKLDSWWCPRHFLHAQAIRFSHPATNQQLVLQAPLSQELQLVLDWLEQVKRK